MTKDLLARKGIDMAPDGKSLRYQGKTYEPDVVTVQVSTAPGAWGTKVTVDGQCLVRSLFYPEEFELCDGFDGWIEDVDGSVEIIELFDDHLAWTQYLTEE